MEVLIIFLHLHLYMTSGDCNILSVFSVGRQAGEFNSLRNKIIVFILWKFIKTITLIFSDYPVLTDKVLRYHLLEIASIVSVFNVYFTFLNKKCRYRSFLYLNKILCPYVWISECFDGLSHMVGIPLPAYKAISLGQRKKKLCQT